LRNLPEWRILKEKKSINALHSEITGFELSPIVEETFTLAWTPHLGLTLLFPYFRSLCFFDDNLAVAVIFLTQLMEGLVKLLVQPHISLAAVSPCFASEYGIMDFP